MNSLILGVCFWALFMASLVLNADNRDHGNSTAKTSDRVIVEQANLDPKFQPALKKIEEWVNGLNQRLSKDIDKSVEKLLATLDKPTEMAGKLFDVLAQSEQQYEPDEKTVFGEKLEKFSVEDRKKLVIAWTSKLQEFLRKRVIKISKKLDQSGKPKAKELKNVLIKLSQAHAQAYEKYKEEIKKSADPRLFCFACDGHIGDFNYHDDMSKQIQQALSAWLSSTGSVSANVSREPGNSSAVQGSGQKKSAMTPHGQGSVAKYIATLTDESPNPWMYPTPENMAPVLGLTSPDNFSYLKWKGAGQHYTRGPEGQEFGVEINWDIIKSQSLDEQKRVLAIFEEIVTFDTAYPFKVVNGKPDQNGQIPTTGQDGYCLWCNLKHYHPSVVELEKLRTSVQSQRNK